MCDGRLHTFALTPPPKPQPLNPASAPVIVYSRKEESCVYTWVGANKLEIAEKLPVCAVEIGLLNLHPRVNMSKPRAQGSFCH